MPDLTELVIPARFNGPPESANGGYFAGRTAQLLGALAGTALDVRTGAAAGMSAVVTLRTPPPLDLAMEVAAVSADPADGITVRDDETLVAQANLAQLDIPEVEPVTYEEALDAATAYGGLVAHPFPTCFTCGLGRPSADGLALRPGLLGGDRPNTTAAAWIPDASLSGSVIGPEFVWAALDCPGGWTVDLVGRPMVLGRMSAHVAGVPAVGEPCVVMGTLLGREGRKAFTATTAYGQDGRTLGRAAATWIAI